MDDKTYKILNIVLNEKKSEYIKRIDHLTKKEKELTILNNKINKFYEELFTTFQTLSGIINRHIINEYDEEEDEDLETFIMNNNHLLNILDYEKEYTKGFMDALKGVVLGYNHFLMKQFKYGEIRDIICKEINPDESEEEEEDIIYNYLGNTTSN